MTTKVIKLKMETWNKVCKHGKYGDTVDDVVNRILVKATNTTKVTKATKKIK